MNETPVDLEQRDVMHGDDTDVVLHTALIIAG